MGSEMCIRDRKKVVEPAGGSVTYDSEGQRVPDGTDIVIAVYGEDPYAEFQGDRANVDFEPNDFNPEFLERYQADGVPVVSVFISGRPLWTNPEINSSDAFVAAWLPGSEPGGITDLLFRTQSDFDFTGRLSFSCLLYTSPSPRDATLSRMPSSA